jgi:hypothetical protein
MKQDQDSMTEKPFAFSVSARRLTPVQIVNMFDQGGRRSELASVFGFLDESPLNGGRPRADSVPFPLTEIEKLNDMGIGYSFTLTNTAVAPEHLKDAHTNELLKRFERPINSVIVATDLVADYVREHYPAYKIRASCLCNFTTAEQINAACGRFDMVTPWPELNASDGFLGQLKHKDQIMLFGSQACLASCVENRLRHYFLASLDHIMFYNHRQYGTSYHPEDFEWTFPSFCRGKDVPILLEDLDRCRRLGFTNIKVVHPAQFAAHYLGIQPKPVGKIASFVRSRIPGRNPSVNVRPDAKKS